MLGFENLPGQGGVLMLGNHISWLDWAMVQIACPRPVRFVMHREIYQRWYLKWFLDLFGVIPIAGGHSKQALEQINQLLRDGEVVCLFPEGSISRNTQLRGDVIVAFGKPLPIETPAHALKSHVFELSIDAWEQHTRTLDPIPLAWLRTAKRRGGDLCLADAQGDTTLSGYKTMTGVIAFSRLIEKRSPESNIGILLPTSSAGAITNMATLLRGKTVINLNYTATQTALHSAVGKAAIKTVYTSRRFLKKLQQKGIDLSEALAQVEVIYLEDLKEEIGGFTKLLIMTASILLPARLLFALFGQPIRLEQPAAILFSSGSEGEPKGVVLSHRNIMANGLRCPRHPS